MRRQDYVVHWNIQQNKVFQAGNLILKRKIATFNGMKKWRRMYLRLWPHKASNLLHLCPLLWKFIWFDIFAWSTTFLKSCLHALPLLQSNCRLAHSNSAVRYAKLCKVRRWRIWHEHNYCIICNLITQLPGGNLGTFQAWNTWCYNNFLSE